MAGKTLYDKLWDMHLVKQRDDGSALIYIDRHILHEVTSPQAFEGLRLAGRKPWRIDANIATPDHNVPTTRTERKGGIAAIADEVSRLQVQTLDENCDDFGITEFKMNDVRQGIVHVVGPEQGATLPGMTVVCGDSHTSTHGAFGALAHGIGTSEVEHVLATQCLVAKKMKNMLVKVEGRLPAGVTAKDIVLAVIGRIGTAGGNGHAIEFAGSAIRDLSIEGRMTICNMSIEAGARVGLVAVDQKTIDYVKGRPFAPSAEQWDQAVACWQGLVSDADARFDTVVELDAAQIKPQVSWGTSPEMVLAVDQNVPDPARESDPIKRGSIERALKYMGLRPKPGDHRHPAGPGIHRFLHQLADRGPARCRRSCQGPQGRRDHQAGAGGAGFRVGQGAGREGRPGPDLHRGRLRMARAGLFHVPGDEPGPAGERRTLRLDLQPQLRGPSGRRWPYPPGQPGDGRRRGRQRPLHRCPRIARLRRTEMKPYTQTTGLVAPLDRANVDTDQIIPKQFLKSIKRTGFGPNLFDEWRYLDVGQPGQDNSKRPLNPDFVLNQPRYQGASVLLARENFGCGSSREHAPWALDEYGFRTVIAPSYADIFFNNSFKNGLLPIILPEAEVDELFRQVEANEGYQLSIDLAAQTVTRPDGKVLGFEVDPFRKHCLLNGLDDIGLTLQDADAIRAFEDGYRQQQPWLFR